MGGIHRWPMDPPHKRPATRNMFSFDDVIMTRVRGEAWPQFGYHHPFLIAWCKHMLGLPRTLWTHVTGGNFHRFSEATDRKMPVVGAVSGDCERVHGIIHYTRLNHCKIRPRLITQMISAWNWNPKLIKLLPKFNPHPWYPHTGSRCYCRENYSL